MLAHETHKNNRNKYEYEIQLQKKNQEY
jgi:hypothetical protein